MSAREVRVSVDEAGFAQIVQGEVVEFQARDQDGQPVVVKVALKDIGFDRIQAIADDAPFAAWQKRNQATKGA